MEASTSQHDDTHKLEDPPASPKRPKKMRYDNRQTHHQNGHAERPGVSPTRTGKFRCHSPRPSPLTTLSNIISEHDGGNKTSDININAITNSTRVGMLTKYIRRHYFDTVFLQEITSVTPTDAWL